MDENLFSLTWVISGVEGGNFFELDIGDLVTDVCAMFAVIQGVR